MWSLLSTLLAVVAGLLLVREFRFAMTSIRTERWRSTTGTLENADDASAAVSANARYSYSYQVDDQSYRSKHIGFGFPDNFADLVAKSEIARINAAAPNVEVFYDPRKPDVSVLVRGFQPYHAVRMLPVIVLLAIALPIAFL